MQSTTHSKQGSYKNNRARFAATLRFKHIMTTISDLYVFVGFAAIIIMVITFK